MRVGVLVTGDIAVRAAHSLSAHRDVDEVVVVGPARTRSFRVVPNASGCDLLVGTGPTAPDRASELGVGLVWDGDDPRPGVVVTGASPVGLALALAAREADPRLVAVAHPDLAEGRGREVRFPDPVGALPVADSIYGGLPVATAASPNRFAACLTEAKQRRVTVVDEGAFMSGIALAAGVFIAGDTTKAVWHDALSYLEAAATTGLVLAEDR